MRSQSSTYLGDAPMAEIETGMAEVVAEGFLFLAPLPMSDQAGETAQSLLVEAEGFTNFTCGRFATVRDDVCRHGGAKFSITLIDVFDGLLALVA